MHEQESLSTNTMHHCAISEDPKRKTSSEYLIKGNRVQKSL